MPSHDIIVAGASAGGIEALSRVVRDLPVGLGAAVLVVVHLPADSASVLPQILMRAGRLPAAHADDGERIVRGRIYVAPPDRHLLVSDGHVRLSVAPPEHGHRPAIDPLFRSAARWFGSRVAGVVLSGNLNDGAAGLSDIVRCGGAAIVQQPEDALFAGMPRSAIDYVRDAVVLPVSAIGATLARLSRNGPATTPSDGGVIDATKPGEDPEDGPAVEGERRPGPYICPECHGTLREVYEGELLRYRCREGHAFTGETLAAAQFNDLTAVLWRTLRNMEDSAALTRRLSEHAAEAGRSSDAAAHFEAQTRHTERRIQILRDVLESGTGWETRAGPTPNSDR